MGRQDGSWSGWMRRRARAGPCRGRSPRPSSGVRPSTSCTGGSSLSRLYEGRGPTQVDPVLLEQGSRAILDKAIGSVGTTGIDFKAMLVEGEPAPVLTQLAVGADLLVVGSRGPRRLRRPLARLGESAVHRIGTLPRRGGPPRCGAADAHDRGRGRRIGAFGRGAALGGRRSTAPDATGSRERVSRNPSRAAVRTRRRSSDHERLEQIEHSCSTT